MKRTRKNITACIRNNSQLKRVLTNYLEQPTIMEISVPGIPIDLNLIPNTVHTLKFNYNFENLPCEIPSNIKKVYFYEFSDLLEELPDTIVDIEIHKGFNHPVDKLHQGLKSISFGWNFNQPIDNLPSSIEKIVLGNNFSHSINNLPSNIKFLYISNPNYDYETIKKLPKSLIFLQLGVKEDINFEFSYDILNNLNRNYMSQFEKNYGVNDFTYSNTQYFKNYYFYKV
jgi:hypothetical protein